MKILVLNCGSSSLKFSLVQLPDYEPITAGLVERVGTPEAFIKYTPKGAEDSVKKTVPVLNHTQGVQAILETLLGADGYLSSLDEIDAIGHRLVHGAEVFTDSLLITDEVVEELRRNIPIAPLHNPANIQGIEAAMAVLPSVPQVGVFDTAFHQTMPERAYIYGIPYELYEQYRVRRYGFHGTSHKYVSQRAAEFLGLDLSKLKIVTAHVGSGASISAIDGGKSIDTSMGMTPCEGLMMGTRSGDIDPGLIEWLLNKRDYKPEDIAAFVKNEAERGKKTHLDLSDLMNMLNKQSGLYGVAGIGSSDMRDIDKAIAEGNHRARLAADILFYRVKKYVGAYAAALEGLDVLVFTAGVGENSATLRQSVCKGLEFMGIELDEEINRTAPRGQEALISKPNSRVKVVVIPTDEEYMIALDTYNVITHGKA